MPSAPVAPAARPGRSRPVPVPRRLPDAVADLRRRAGAAVFARVAGPEGPANRERVHLTPGPRWFATGSPIQRVHGDASMFVGGLRALLLQSLHPSAMAAVAGHSGYRGDPWGRLARTSTFLAFTTFGAADDAAAAVARVRGIHDRVRGRTPDGVPYVAGDPELLAWVHVAEVDSFLRAHDRYGARPLDPAGRDEYVAQTAVVGRALGAADVPTTTAELRERLDGFRPQLRATVAALDTARFLLREPPLGGPLRLPYGLLTAGAVELLPAWARAEIRLRGARTPARAAVARASGATVTRLIRWVMAATPPPPSPSPDAPVRPPEEPPSGERRADGRVVREGRASAPVSPPRPAAGS